MTNLQKPNPILHFLPRQMQVWWGRAHWPFPQMPRVQKHFVTKDGAGATREGLAFLKESVRVLCSFAAAAWYRNCKRKWRGRDVMRLSEMGRRHHFLLKAME